MVVSKPKKPQRTPEDVDILKSDVASFASSLGLAAGDGTFGGSGFDDSDFRKSGPIKPQQSGKNLEKSTDLNQKSEENHDIPRPKPKPHPLDVGPFTNSEKKDLPKLPLMKASLLSGQWYIDADELEIKVLGEEGRRKVPALGIDELKALVAKKREVAEGLMEQYSRDYDVSRRNKGDMRLLEVTARSGTSADKVSAFTCLVEDNPIANMRSLDALLSMVTSKVGKRYAFTGFEALRELFLLRLLPDRKLRALLQHPLDELPETKDGFSLLLFWYWEECLKQRYERFVIALEESLKDMLPNLKDKAMKTVYVLLKSKPEQERKLLAALVNKLGDPERKAASGAAYHLSCLLSAHPNMKAVVIDEVDSFIFRPHIGLRAKYQAVNFLSQILLSSKGDGPKVAKRLLDVYFALFKVLISDARSVDNRSGAKGSKKGNEKGKLNKKKTSSLHDNKGPIESIEMDSRLLSALLTGVNRAFPYVTSDEADDILEVQMPILFKLVHAENFNVGVQSLMLLYQISSRNQILSDRFYRALYSKLLTPAALNSSKPEMFLGLLFKAMKNDVNLKRVSAFSKRLLQVSLQRPAQYACGCLFLLSEVLKAKPPLWSMALQNESVDDDLEHFVDIIEEPQNSSAVPSSKTPGSSGAHAAAFDSVKPPASYACVHDDSDGEDHVNDGTQFQSGYANKGPGQESSAVGYDPRHREPSYCNADRTSWWELTTLAAHVHPSVATMARTLLSGATIVYNGDPLNDLSLGAFLDKFMEKKPKASRRAEGKWHGGSQIAPAKKLDTNHRLIGDEILQLAEEDVPPEDVVFHRFYMNKTTSSKKPKAKKKKASEDEDADDLLPDINDDSEEEEIDNMLGSGKVPMDDETEGYDYDDLDKFADDDDALLGNGSDTEVADAHTLEKHPKEQIHGDDEDGEDFDDVLGVDNGDSDDDGDGDDDDDESIIVKKSKQVGKKRKHEKKTRPSPFASAEEFEHLMADKEKKARKLKKNKKSH
ncbi:CCAAT/enhancer-binding protein zeta [Dioscorea cayenensis subsp. rotundata]|uniref:CCAAT/enhancer-binding protein zeta n=1 Tax=Dioscorea cayennensis subsp. rotundata TaxID=55577 RepID=A0AB40BKA1_DIOCR|nr:CCAAT/enhancer-binding protein zeta [Dioscorea cayenensis subsp. rotundata]